MLKPYYSYLLRLQRSADRHDSSWSASLEDPHTHQLMVFSSLDQCFDYLKQITGAAAAPTDQQEGSNSNNTGLIS